MVIDPVSTAVGQISALPGEGMYLSPVARVGIRLSRGAQSPLWRASLGRERFVVLAERLPESPT